MRRILGYENDFFLRILKLLTSSLKNIVEIPPQLSYSVNAVLTEVAVRGDVCRSNGTIARKEKISVPQKTPYES